MLSAHRRIRCALLLTLSAPFAIHAQPAPAPTVTQLDQVLSSQSRARTIAQVAVSPDGKRIAWLESGQIRIAPIDDLAHSQPVTAAAPGTSCNASDLIWSPNSASLAFLSDCADPGGQPDLFLSHLDGNSAHRITQLHGFVDAPAFSPDGSRIAFLYIEGATRPASALAAEDLPSGVIGEDHVEIQRVAFVAATSQLATSQIEVPTFATPPNLHVFEFDWSPDSKSLAYIAADPPGENNWWVAKLYTQAIAAVAPSNMADTTESGGHVEWDPKPTVLLAPFGPRSPARSTAYRSPFLAGHPTESQSP